VTSGLLGKGAPSGALGEEIVGGYVVLLNFRGKVNKGKGGWFCRGEIVDKSGERKACSERLTRKEEPDFRGDGEKLIHYLCSLRGSGKEGDPTEVRDDPPPLSQPQQKPGGHLSRIDGTY